MEEDPTVPLSPVNNTLSIGDDKSRPLSSCDRTERSGNVSDDYEDRELEVAQEDERDYRRRRPMDQFMMGFTLVSQSLEPTETGDGPRYADLADSESLFSTVTKGMSKASY